MTDAIAIDTSRYECATGRKPRGKGSWTFRLVSPLVTYSDHFFTAPPDTDYRKALAMARDLAKLRRSDHIVLVVTD
ncbi:MULTISPECIES: hypothetical protein [unclassified Bradyrhizobium]|uniref:hypothetical protein n=1 Tax=Bradyrhizobium sp. USDA 4541 TaxID=2817704 RepID=UPI0020A54B57|nr:hypothetical protein [Bradyrhizobium sp. USDA 4541]MCP1854234.1 hypothetical protein [Bradyrhizobium sp. USDA 4541]